MCGAQRDGPCHPARWTSGGVRVLHAGGSGFATVYKEYLMRALAPGGSGGVKTVPTLMCTWLSRFAPGRTRPPFAHRIAEAGWSEVRWRNLTGGIVALHTARK